MKRVIKLWVTWQFWPQLPYYNLATPSDPLNVPVFSSQFTFFYTDLQRHFLKSFTSWDSVKKGDEANDKLGENI